mmetsp:Transcript_6046/g.9244  ORF Transcript_6046/g.9244 Transcript_6046/m.9244 type:complete len:498 (+) Transcript_6046:149-1642(+)
MSDDMYSCLVGWIGELKDGFVHQNLSLKINGTQRGIYSTKIIRKGEMLISLPRKNSLSGSGKPSCYSGKNVSDWLRCVASYYECHSDNAFQPYITSLPEKYESLLEWLDEEVESFLSGTTLADLIREDRKNKVLENRFQDTVKPYLKHLNLLPSSPISLSEELDFFKKACMCISTRGFHLNNNLNEEESLPSNSYNGPFLLPLIDLLNHDDQKKCTTLQFDASTHCFSMFAERDIASNEEIFHSYGSGLTSAQFLKTFGFVPSRSIDNALALKKGSEDISPAVLSKNEVLSACQTLMDSPYSRSLIEYMKAENSYYEDEFWKMDHDCSTRDLSFLPDDFLVSAQHPLSDELITLFAVLLMPAYVYEEFVKDGVHFVDKAILEDYFLGKLVCQLILHVVSLKLKLFQPMLVEGLQMVENRNKDDKSILEKLHMAYRSGSERTIYGLTVRMEETFCLQSLKDEALSISRYLGGFLLNIEGLPVKAEDFNQGDKKRARIK